MRVLTEAEPLAAAALAARTTDRSIKLRVWFAAGIISVLVLAIYAGAFGALVRDWWTDNQGASYGMLIPPLG